MGVIASFRVARFSVSHVFSIRHHALCANIKRIRTHARKVGHDRTFQHFNNRDDTNKCRDPNSNNGNR